MMVDKNKTKKYTSIYMTKNNHARLNTPGNCDAAVGAVTAAMGAVG
jgi:hypothetical protein